MVNVCHNPFLPLVIVSVAMLIVWMANIDTSIDLQDPERITLELMCICSIASFCIHFGFQCKKIEPAKNHDQATPHNPNFQTITINSKARCALILLSLTWLVACTINFFCVEMYEKIIVQNAFKIRHWTINDKFIPNPKYNKWDLTQVTSQLFYYLFPLLYVLFFYVLFPLFPTVCDARINKKTFILTILLLSCLFLDLWMCSWYFEALGYTYTRSMGNIQFGTRMIMTNICVYFVLNHVKFIQSIHTVDNSLDTSDINIAVELTSRTSGTHSNINVNGEDGGTEQVSKVPAGDEAVSYPASLGGAKTQLVLNVSGASKNTNATSTRNSATTRPMSNTALSENNYRLRNDTQSSNYCGSELDFKTDSSVIIEATTGTIATIITSNETADTTDTKHTTSTRNTKNTTNTTHTNTIINKRVEASQGTTTTKIIGSNANTTNTTNNIRNRDYAGKKSILKPKLPGIEIASVSGRTNTTLTIATIDPNTYNTNNLNVRQNANQGALSHTSDSILLQVGQPQTQNHGHTDETRVKYHTIGNVHVHNKNNANERANKAATTQFQLTRQNVALFEIEQKNNSTITDNSNLKDETGAHVEASQAKLQFENVQNNSSINIIGIECLRCLIMFFLAFSMIFLLFNYYILIFEHSIINCPFHDIDDSLTWIIGYLWQFHAKNIILLLFIFCIVTFKVIIPSIKSEFKEKYKLTWKNAFYLFATLFEYRNERIFLYVYSYFIFAVSFYSLLLYWCLFTWPKQSIDEIVNHSIFYLVLGLFCLFVIAPLLFLINVIFVQLGIKYLYCKRSRMTIISSDDVKQRLNRCTGVGIIYCLLVSIIMCLVLGYRFTPGNVATRQWPVFAIMFIWDFWYNACDIIYYNDINQNGLNIKAIRIYAAGFILGILMILFLIGVIIWVVIDPENNSYNITPLDHSRLITKFVYDISSGVTVISMSVLVPFLSLLYVKYNFMPDNDNDESTFERSESCWYFIHQLNKVFCVDLFSNICKRECCHCKCAECCGECTKCCCKNIVDPLCCNVCFGLIKYVVLHRYCCHSCFGYTTTHMHRFDPKCKRIFIKIICGWLLFVSICYFLQTQSVWYFLFRIFMIISDILTEQSEQSKAHKLRVEMWKIYMESVNC